MKNITIVLLILLSINLHSQTPSDYFQNYQGVIRGNDNKPLKNTTLDIECIYNYSTSTGPIAYQETFTTTTNAFGEFNITLGKGTATLGSYLDIHFGIKLFLNVRINGEDMGATEIFMTPASRYAITSDFSRAPWYSNPDRTEISYDNKVNIGDVSSNAKGKKLNVEAEYSELVGTTPSLVGLKIKGSTPSQYLQILNMELPVGAHLNSTYINTPNFKVYEDGRVSTGGGNIYSSSGHIYTSGGDIQLSSSSSPQRGKITQKSDTSNLLPIAYGYISSTGQKNAGTNNYTVSRTAIGRYTINFDDFDFTNDDFAIVTCNSSTASAIFGGLSGNLSVAIYNNSTNTYSDRRFSFIILKP